MVITAQELNNTNNFHSGALADMFGRLVEIDTPSHDELFELLDAAEDHDDDHRPEEVKRNAGRDTHLAHHKENETSETVENYTRLHRMVGKAGADPDITLGSGEGRRKGTANQSEWDIIREEKEHKYFRFYAVLDGIETDAQRLEALEARLKEMEAEIAELNEEISAREEAENLLDDDINNPNLGGRQKRRQFVQNAKEAGLSDSEIEKFTRRDSNGQITYVDTKAARDALDAHGRDQDQRLKEYKAEHRALQEKYDEMKKGADTVLAERHDDPETTQKKIEEMAQTEMGASALVASTAEAAASGDMSDAEEMAIYAEVGMDDNVAQNLAASDNIEEFLALEMVDLEQAESYAAQDMLVSTSEEDMFSLVGDDNSLSAIGNITPLFADRAADITTADIAQQETLEQNTAQYVHRDNSRTMAYGMAA